MKTLEALEKNGYQIRTDGREIKLSYRGQGKPDPSTVKPLMDDLKAHKDEALVVLRERDTSRIFREALHELSAAWISGLLEHTERYHPDIIEVIEQAEEALEETWARVLAGTMTMTDFEDAVTTWRDAYKLTLHEHRQRACGEHEPGKRAECANFWRERNGT